MARFGQSFVRSATNPAFTQGLFQLGQQIGSAPRRAREEAERVSAQNELVAMANTSQMIAENGNLGGLEDQREKLQGMLTSATDEQTREMIIGQIDQLSKLRESAKPVAFEKNVQTLMKAESSLIDAEAQIESLQDDTSPEGQVRLDAAKRAKQAIEQKINALKGDPKIATAVADRKYQAELKALTDEEAMSTAKEAKARRTLLKFKPGTEDWNNTVADLEANDQGAIVKEVEDLFIEREQKLLELQKVRDNNGPFNDAEKAHVERLKLKTTGNMQVDRPALIKALAQEASSVMDIRTREATAMKDAAAMGIVRTHLRMMEEDLDYYSFMSDDLSDIIRKELKNPESNLTNELISAVKGRSPAEARDMVEKVLQEQFPSQYAEAMAEKKDRDSKIQNFQGMVDDAMAVYQKEVDNGERDELPNRARVERMVRDQIKEEQGGVGAFFYSLFN